MLSNRQIVEAQNLGDLSFDGEVRGDALLLRLGNQLLEFAACTVVDPMDKKSVHAGYSTQRNDWQVFDLPPFASVLISSHEQIRLSNNLTGLIGTLSHIARVGLFAHFASPIVGAGFQGRLALELLNVSRSAVRLRPGMAIAKLGLMRIEGSQGLGPFFYNTGPPDLDVDLRSRYFEEFGR